MGTEKRITVHRPSWDGSPVPALCSIVAAAPSHDWLPGTLVTPLKVISGRSYAAAPFGLVLGIERRGDPAGPSFLVLWSVP